MRVSNSTAKRDATATAAVRKTKTQRVTSQRREEVERGHATGGATDRPGTVTDSAPDTEEPADTESRVTVGVEEATDVALEGGEGMGHWENTASGATAAAYEWYNTHSARGTHTAVERESRSTAARGNREARTTTSATQPR